MIVLVGTLMAAVQAGQVAPVPPSPPKVETPVAAKPPAAVEWTEGVTLPVRVPVLAPGRECMTTLSFPEDSIETAITGWADGEITAIQKHGLLFLRLARKSEGQLNVIGASGTHYLFYLRGVDAAEPESYDAYLRIEKKAAREKADVLPRRSSHRPSAAIDLIQAMRLGVHPEHVRILRAQRELAFESPVLEVRLLYVYDADAYRGMIYEIRNPTTERQAVDASRFRGKGTALILTALKENVLLPGAVSRLYALTWKD